MLEEKTGISTKDLLHISSLLEGLLEEIDNLSALLDDTYKSRNYIEAKKEINNLKTITDNEATE